MPPLPSIDTVFPKKDMHSSFHYWNDPSSFHSSTAVPFDMARNGMMTYNTDFDFFLYPSSSSCPSPVPEAFTVLPPSVCPADSADIFANIDTTDYNCLTFLPFSACDAYSTDSFADIDTTEYNTTLPFRGNAVTDANLFNIDAQKLVYAPSQADSLMLTLPLSTTEVSLPSTTPPMPTPILKALLNAPPLYSTPLVSPEENHYGDMQTIGNSNPGAILYNLDAQKLVYAPSQADSLMLALPLSTTEFAPSLSSTTPPMPTPILKALLNAPPLNSTRLDSPQENYYDDVQIITSSPSPVDSPIESPAVSRPSRVESTSDSDDSVNMEKKTKGKKTKKEKKTKAPSTVTILSSASSINVSRKQSNGYLTLWAFIARIALNPAKKGIVVWTGEGYQFRIVNPLLFCKVWSRHQSRHDTTPWSSVQRAIRLSYGKGKRVGMILNDLKSRRDNAWTFVNELPQVLFIPKEALEDYIYAHNEKGPLTNGRVPLRRTLHPYVHSSLFPLKSFLDHNGEPLYPCDSLIDIVKNASMSIPLIPSLYDQSIFNAYEQNCPGPMYGYSAIESNPHCLYNPY